MDEYSLIHLTPENASTFGGDIDSLWLVIYWITMITFVVVEILVVYFGVKYWRRWKKLKGQEQKAHYTHGSHKLEVTWTIATAAILVFLFWKSTNTWAHIKVATPDDIGMEVKVEGQQFAWNISYLGKDGVMDTPDDVAYTGFLVVPANENVLVHLTSRDVIHSFFVPSLRVKQDAVPYGPGNYGQVWFNAKATDPGPDGEYMSADDVPYQIACAELCGLGHSEMAAKLYVVPRPQFDVWMQQQIDAQ